MVYFPSLLSLRSGVKGDLKTWVGIREVDVRGKAGIIKDRKKTLMRIGRDVTRLAK